MGVRDAMGTIMGTYDRYYSGSTNRDSIFITEFPVYGSSRLGALRENGLLAVWDLPNLTTYSLTKNKRELGMRHYEQTNHLGNVLATITDKKLQVDSDANDTIDYYTADVSSTSDYYAFGMLMPGRNSNPSEYKYGYQGSLKDNDIKGTGNHYSTYFRQHDPRLGRWFSTDPVTTAYESPYASMRNNPVALNDPNGDCPCLLITAGIIIVGTAYFAANLAYAANTTSGGTGGLSPVPSALLEGGNGPAGGNSNPILGSEGYSGGNEKGMEDLQPALKSKTVQERVENLLDIFEEGDYITTETIFELSGVSSDQEEGEKPGTSEQRDIISNIERIQKTKDGFEIILKGNQESIEKSVSVYRENKETGERKKSFSLDLTIKNKSSVKVIRTTEGIKLKISGVKTGKGFFQIGLPTITISGNEGSIFGLPSFNVQQQ